MRNQNGDVLKQCPNCRATHSFEVKFRQYLDTYSSTPSSVAVDGSEVVGHVCCCGQLVSIYRVPHDERQSFQNSVDHAQRYRDEHEPEQRKAKLRESFAVREEVESLAQSVAQLTKILAGLTKAQSDNPAAAAGKKALYKRKAPQAKD